MAQISDENSDMNSNDGFSSSAESAESAESVEESSDDDSIIDVGSNDYDLAYVMSAKKSSAKTIAALKKPFKNEKNKKRHHNASEKVRRTQLKSCFIALKTAIGHPDTSNNEALKLMAQEIDRRQAESKRLDEEIKKIQRENMELERLQKKSKTK